MSLQLQGWLDVLDAEYLRTFVSVGGGTVKIAVPADASYAVAERVAAAARSAGFLVASVDARTTRVDRVDQLFAAVSCQLEWHELAARVRERAVVESSYETPSSGHWTFDAIAEANNNVAPHFVRKALEQWFTDNVFRDYKMSQDFRMAMSRLCFDPMLSAAPQAGGLTASIVEWVKGELRLLSAVRPAQIYQKVARHNARDLLLSASHWARAAGYSGLVVTIDMDAISSRSKASSDGALFYTRSAVMDLYEVLRQFIDSTDEMDGLCVVAVANAAFLEDEQRGIDMYQALKLRVSEEVRDRSRDNPLAALVRIGTA